MLIRQVAVLGLQVFPQRARPTMPRKTCGKKAIKEVQGLEAAALIRQAAAVLIRQAAAVLIRQAAAVLIRQAAAALIRQAAAVLIRQAAALGLQVFPQRTPMP